MNYREALAWLYGTQLFGIKLGLETIRRLVAELNVPAPTQRIIHVAGTNGKGSVCAMLDSILRIARYRSGLFTSPHLVTFRERIQVNGEMISDDEVATGLTSIRELIRDWDPHPTFFEIVTALALQHFRRRACDVIVLETGMGGRLDATNVVTPVVSVITPISYDHQKWLGNSLGEIASEKAGIIKPGVPVVSAKQEPEAQAVIRETATRRGSSLRIVDTEYDGDIALPGMHQKENAALALAALEAANISVSPDAIANGVANVQWPARFQRWDERLVIDGAHNPAGANVLVRTWRRDFAKEQPAVILAVLRDKDIAGIAQILATIASRFVLPQARTERALPPQELADIVRGIAPEISIECVDSLGDAMRATEAEPHVLIAGSLHFAGEALAHLRGEPAAFEECGQ